MGSIQTPVTLSVTLYSVDQALVFLKSLGLDHSDTWLRNRMRDEKLGIYRVGNSDFVTETDLYRLSRLPELKRGPKKKSKGNK